MQQLSLFDDFDLSDEKPIKKIHCKLFSFEVGKDEVAKIELTEQGSEKLDIYKVTNVSGELIVHAGMLIPHGIEY